MLYFFRGDRIEVREIILEELINPVLRSSIRNESSAWWISEIMVRIFLSRLPNAPEKRNIESPRRTWVSFPAKNMRLLSIGDSERRKAGTIDFLIDEKVDHARSAMENRSIGWHIRHIRKNRGLSADLYLKSMEMVRRTAETGRSGWLNGDIHEFTLMTQDISKTAIKDAWLKSGRWILTGRI